MSLEKPQVTQRGIEKPQISCPREKPRPVRHPANHFTFV